jgi:hypothetical protein
MAERLAALALTAALATCATGAYAADPVIGKFNGPGGCAASSCHGSIQPKTVTRIPQNEYSIWAGQDKHARAYQVLSNPVSVRIARILKLDRPANETPRCLACHALAPAAEERAQSFDVGDGVSCELCHGPASGWLGAHTVKDWESRTPEQKGKLGMNDLGDLAVRTHICTHCHVGTAEKFVDHQLIAAGHPDLTFELNLFSAVMPRHWRDPKDNPWFSTKEWVVGQSMQLRDSLTRLARSARGPNWPEYAELDCFACHHSLTRPEESWRLTADDYYGSRRVGVPAWNAARYAVFRYAAKEADAATAAKLESEITTLTTQMNQLTSDREQVASSAERAAELAHTLAGELNASSFDRAFTLLVMRRIAADSHAVSVQGQRAAEQATMTLDSLFTAYKQNAKPANEADLHAAINTLFQQLDNPSAYDAPRFAAQMQKVDALLAREGAVAGGR